jgi:hypothetical protein
MRNLMLAAVAASAVVAAPALAGGNNEFEADLDSGAEVPRNTSEADGEAEFTISRTGRSISYKLEAEDLSGRAQAAHVHLGRPGQAGPVLLTICGRPCTLPRSGRLTARRFSKAAGVPNFRTAVRRLRAGRTYVNIHTAKYKAGEIRGQIERDSSG